jgi:hypothetical protein
MNYAGFWQRFAAPWIDTFVLFIPILFLWWLQSVFRPAALIALLPHLFMAHAYEIYFHGRCGRTIYYHAIESQATRVARFHRRNRRRMMKVTGRRQNPLLAHRCRFGVATCAPEI